MARYYRCIKTFKSIMFPDVDYGTEGYIYVLQEPDGIYDKNFINGYFLLKLIGLDENDYFQNKRPRGWLNSERFVEVTVDESF